MALRPLANPYSLNNARLIIEEDDYTEPVSQVQFDPSTARTSWTGIGGNTLAGQSPATWTCQLSLAQDLAPAGLLRYLLDNDGRKVEAILVPEADGPAIRATLVLAPATIGGSAGADVTTASVTLGVDGRPTFDDAYVAPAA